MFKLLKKVLDRFLEVLLTVVMTVLVLDVVWQVFTRYMSKPFPNLIQPSNWTDELATFLMIWVGMIGASVALYRGAHLGIDYFVSRLSVRNRMMTEVFVSLLIGVFSVAVMLVGGIQIVQRTLERGQVSPAIGLKMGYVYLAMPISGFFLTIYSVEILVEKCIALVKHQPDGPGPGTEMTQAD
jgi:TRAP-type C4-dicarboxylate transport system permease small subunit